MNSELNILLIVVALKDCSKSNALFTRSFFVLVELNISLDYFQLQGVHDT